jgi:hypothetical protein
MKRPGRGFMEEKAKPRHGCVDHWSELSYPLLSLSVARVHFTRWPQLRPYIFCLDMYSLLPTQSLSMVYWCHPPIVSVSATFLPKLYGASTSTYSHLFLDFPCAFAVIRDMAARRLGARVDLHWRCVRSCGLICWTWLSIRGRQISFPTRMYSLSVWTLVNGGPLVTRLFRYPLVSS